MLIDIADMWMGNPGMGETERLKVGVREWWEVWAVDVNRVHLLMLAYLVWNGENRQVIQNKTIIDLFIHISKFGVSWAAASLQPMTHQRKKNNWMCLPKWSALWMSEAQIASTLCQTPAFVRLSIRVQFRRKLINWFQPISWTVYLYITCKICHHKL